MDSLTVVQKHRQGEISEGRSIKIDRYYLDFIVSGQSLKEHLGLLESDLIGPLGWVAGKERESNLINEFLGLTKPDLPTGRTSFYVCPRCGDIGCGAITALIELTEKTVIWQDFGYENDYETLDLTRYEHIGPFVFDKVTYYNLFRRLMIQTLNRQ